MRIVRHIGLGLAIAAALVAPALVAPALADTGAAPSPNAVVLQGGTDLSPTWTYTSLGLTYALRGNINVSGPLVRLWGDRFTYDFEDGFTRIGATGWEHSYSFGYQFKDAKGSETLYTGYDSQSTSLSPLVKDPGEGTHGGVLYELDATRTFLGVIHANADGGYSSTNRNYWIRGGFASGPPTHAWFGPIFSWVGNVDYHGFRSGLGLSNVRLGSHIGAQLSLGVQHIARGAGIFTGVNFVVIP